MAAKPIAQYGSYLSNDQEITKSAKTDFPKIRTWFAILGQSEFKACGINRLSE